MAELDEVAHRVESALPVIHAHKIKLVVLDVGVDQDHRDAISAESVQVATGGARILRVGDDPGGSLGAPVAVQSANVLYLAAPLFSAYRNHDYWIYRAIVQRLLSAFLPPPLLKPTGPGWVEYSLLRQRANADHAARSIVHVVCYHPRRTMQPIAHVDQSWPTSGLAIALRVEQAPQRVYLAPQGESVEFAFENGVVQVALPPVGAHTLVVVE